MSDSLYIGNNGQDIEQTNYFDLEIAQKGYILLSVNAGCIRVLTPDSMEAIVSEVQNAAYAVISRGPSPKMAQGKEMWEIVFEDFSQAPYALFLSPEQFADFQMSPEDKEWDLAIHVRSGCAVKMKAYLREEKVEIPCLRPLQP